MYTDRAYTDKSLLEKFPFHGVFYYYPDEIEGDGSYNLDDEDEDESGANSDGSYNLDDEEETETETETETEEEEAEEEDTEDTPVYDDVLYDDSDEAAFDDGTNAAYDTEATVMTDDDADEESDGTGDEEDQASQEDETETSQDDETQETSSEGSGEEEDSGEDEEDDGRIVILETPCDIQQNTALFASSTITRGYKVYFPFDPREATLPEELKPGCHFKGEMYGLTVSGTVLDPVASQLGGCMAEIRGSEV